MMFLSKRFSKRLATAGLHIQANLKLLIAVFLSLCGIAFVVTLAQLRQDGATGVAEVTRKDSNYADTEVKNCIHRTPGRSGRTYETVVRGVGVSFVSWTKNDTFDREVVPLRTHEAVRIMSKFERPATILDVGANIGKVTFPIMAMPQTHTVIAVEPVAVNMNMLCMTANLNGWLGHPGMTLLEAAMSDEAGTMSIFVPEAREDNAALNSEAATANVHEPKHDESVQVLVADDVLREGGFKPDIIKIDTQGHEIHVLKGLKTYLGAAKAGTVLVMAESDPKLMQISGVNPKDVYRLMTTELGYSSYCRPYIQVTNGEIEVKGTVISREDYPPGGCRDIFYFKQPR